MFNASRLVSRVVASCFVVGASSALGAAHTYVDHMFQANGSVVKTVTGSLYDRHLNPYVGLRIFIGGFSNGSQVKNPVDGDTWVLTNTRLATSTVTETHTIVYDAASDCISYDGTPDLACGFAIPAGQTGLKGWFIRVPFYGKCEYNGDHVLNAAYNGASIIGAPRTYHPTRLRPTVKSVSAPSQLRPKLAAETPAGLTEEPEAAGEKKKIEVLVVDAYGCNRVPEDVEMDMRTTFVSSGGHTHFSGGIDRGDGIFTPLTPGMELNSDPTITGVKGPLISDPLSIHWGRFAADYEGGEFGAKEKLSIKAKLPKNAEEAVDITAIRSETISIRLSNMANMSEDGADHRFVFGGTCAHDPTARTGTLAVVLGLSRVARAYHEHIGNRLSFNDIGLEYGGFYDRGEREKSEANECHDWHRRGTDVDINRKDIVSPVGTPLPQLQYGSPVDEDFTANDLTLSKLEWLKRFMCRENFRKYEGETEIHFRLQANCGSPR